MKTIAIIQARMGSTRLPGKVLEDICGKTMLARVVSRVRRASLLDCVVVATTVEPSDDAIVVECQRLGVSLFRGSESDVLDRYYRAAQAEHGDSIVRITSDCPLVDPDVIDQVVGAFLEQVCDYASNTLERTFPRGLDTEAVQMNALARAWGLAKEGYQRTHVTPYFYQNPDAFRLVSVKADADYSQYRWTVDTPEDMRFVRQVYARLSDKDTFSWRDVLALVQQEPQLAELNRRIPQKTLREG